MHGFKSGFDPTVIENGLDVPSCVNYVTEWVIRRKSAHAQNRYRRPAARCFSFYRRKRRKFDGGGKKPANGEHSMTACIVGWAHTPFGRLDTESVESLIVRVANAALTDAGVDAADVDEIVLGHFNAGFSAQDFTAALVLEASPALRFKRATRVENACATGSAAVHQALRAIDAKAARIALVVGVEQMTTTPGPEIGRNLLKASYVREEADIEGGFSGIFGKIAGQYFQKHGDQSEALALIAAKNHKNGVGNPYAQMRKDLGYDFCRAVSDKNPYVAGPLKRTDCSLVSDGAAALVIADVETALRLNKAVAFRAAQHVQDFLPMSKRDILKFEGCAVAWQRALAQAGIALRDLSLVETHDCFTIAELIEYEAMGLAPEGQGARAVKDGVTQKDGALPINPSGGLKAKGHPIGATGVSMHALAAMQLTNTAGDMQVKDARLAGLFNMGGAAVANYVSILERIR
jgi:acetyl-CoA C-acetyltransferase